MAKKKRSGRKLEKRVKRYREGQKDRLRKKNLADLFETDELGELENTSQRIGSRKSRADTRLEVIQHAAESFNEHGVVAASNETEISENGRVLEIMGKIAKVEIGDDVLDCILHMELRTIMSADKNFLVVGDRVCAKPDDTGEHDGIILAVYKRDSWLSRRSGRLSHVERVLAANVDNMCIVASLVDPPLRPALIDRFLVAASVGNLDPTIVINKIDLATDEEIAAARELLAPYMILGYPITFVSALKRKNIDAIRGFLTNHTTIFAGHSGVGKSAMVNAIDPRYKLRTGEISETTGKGKHTTSRAMLLPLRFGGYVVDTPGIRGFSLWDVDRTDLALYYPEMKNISSECRYPGCTHTHEPDCAVKDAVDSGDIQMLRYENYLKIYESLEDTPPA